MQIYSRLNLFDVVGQRRPDVSACFKLIQNNKLPSEQISENIILMIWVSIFKIQLDLKKCDVITGTTHRGGLLARVRQHQKELEKQLQFQQQHFLVGLTRTCSTSSASAAPSGSTSSCSSTATVCCSASSRSPRRSTS